MRHFGHYLGFSLQAEVIILTLVGIAVNIFDYSVLELNSNLHKVWTACSNLDPTKFSDKTELVIKYVLTGVVFTRTLSVHLYLAFYIVMLWPAIFEDKPGLMLPWLIVGAIKCLGMGAVTMFTGLYTCSVYGELKPACLDFILAHIIEHAPSIYMWFTVFSFYHDLACVLKIIISAENQAKQEFESELVSRRRKARSLDEKTGEREDGRNPMSESTIESLLFQLSNQLENRSSRSLDTLVGVMAAEAEKEEILTIYDELREDQHMTVAERAAKLLKITAFEIAQAQKRKAERTGRTILSNLDLDLLLAKIDSSDSSMESTFSEMERKIKSRSRSADVGMGRTKHPEVNRVESGTFAIEMTGPEYQMRSMAKRNVDEYEEEIFPSIDNSVWAAVAAEASRSEEPVRYDSTITTTESIGEIFADKNFSMEFSEFKAPVIIKTEAISLAIMSEESKESSPSDSDSGTSNIATAFDTVSVADDVSLHEDFVRNHFARAEKKPHVTYDGAKKTPVDDRKTPDVVNDAMKPVEVVKELPKSVEPAKKPVEIVTVTDKVKPKTPESPKSAPPTSSETAETPKVKEKTREATKTIAIAETKVGANAKENTPDSTKTLRTTKAKEKTPESTKTPVATEENPKIKEKTLDSPKIRRRPSTEIEESVNKKTPESPKTHRRTANDTEEAPKVSEKTPETPKLRLRAATETEEVIKVDRKTPDAPKSHRRAATETEEISKVDETIPESSRNHRRTLTDVENGKKLVETSKEKAAKPIELPKDSKTLNIDKDSDAEKPEKRVHKQGEKSAGKEADKHVAKEAEKTATKEADKQVAKEAESPSSKEAPKRSELPRPISEVKKNRSKETPSAKKTIAKDVPEVKKSSSKDTPEVNKITSKDRRPSSGRTKTPVGSSRGSDKSEENPPETTKDTPTTPSITTTPSKEYTAKKLPKCASKYLEEMQAAKKAADEASSKKQEGPNCKPSDGSRSPKTPSRSSSVNKGERKSPGPPSKSAPNSNQPSPASSANIDSNPTQIANKPPVTTKQSSPVRGTKATPKSYPVHPKSAPSRGTNSLDGKPPEKIKQRLSDDFDCQVSTLGEYVLKTAPLSEGIRVLEPSRKKSSPRTALTKPPDQIAVVQPSPMGSKVEGKPPQLTKVSSKRSSYKPDGYTKAYLAGASPSKQK